MSTQYDQAPRYDDNAPRRGRKRKTATVVALIGAVVGAVGVAIAAILLTTAGQVLGPSSVSRLSGLPGGS